MTKRAQRYKGGPPAGRVTTAEALELHDRKSMDSGKWMQMIDQRIARVGFKVDPADLGRPMDDQIAAMGDEFPPLVQDQVALARIDADALAVPYPLLNEDRQHAPLRRLAWYVVRLLWWRIRCRRY